jgi:lysophospholipase L1-like esterase
MAALGDSITRAADVCCWYADHPADSWSTGNSPYDGVYSQYEGLVALHPVITNHESNDAVSGAKASGLSTQVSAALGQKPAYVTLLIGANDLCTSSTSNMTSTGNFATQVRASLAALHQGLPEAKIFVSSIPNIYQLWSVLHGNWVARFVWSTAGICQSMLASTNTETARQQVVAREAAFNQILSQACALYSQCRWDQDSGHSALVLVRSELDFDLVAQDEIGAGVPGVGRGEVLAQLGDGGGGALGW